MNLHPMYEINGLFETPDWFIQTPTDITYKVLEHDNLEDQLQEYMKWVRSVFDDSDNKWVIEREEKVCDRCRKFAASPNIKFELGCS